MTAVILRPPAPPRDDITEKAFQDLIVQLAQWCGWRTYHTHDSRRSDAGWPDLVLVRERTESESRGHLLLFRELKARRGRITPEQQLWGRLLLGAGASWAIWKPDDWDLIVETLTTR